MQNYAVCKFYFIFERQSFAESTSHCIRESNRYIVKKKEKVKKERKRKEGIVLTEYLNIIISDFELISI